MSNFSPTYAPTQRATNPVELLAFAPGTVSRQKLMAKSIDTETVAFEHCVRNSTDSYRIAQSFWDMDEMPIIEHAYALYLDRANRPLCWAPISIGGMSGTFFDPKVVFVHALLCGAQSVIMFHNHPSGNLRPSDADRTLTSKLVAAGKMLDIAVLDHLILAPDNRFYSFADEGMMP